MAASLWARATSFSPATSGASKASFWAGSPSATMARAAMIAQDR
jgi:hypothetical protein